MPSVPNAAEPRLFSDLAVPELRLLGPIRADWGDGGSFLPRTIRTRAILAVLALADAKSVRRHLLMSLLWPTRERQQAQASLRQSVHELRGYLAPLKGACLLSERDCLTLRVDHIWIDALFVQSAELRSPHVADVFRGPLLSDLRGISPPFDAWIYREQEKLSERIRIRLAALLAESPSGAATAHMAEAVLAFDASNQAAWTALAESRIAAGNTQAALDVCHRHWQAARRQGGPAEFDRDMLRSALLPKWAGADAMLPKEFRGGALHSKRNPQHGGDFRPAGRTACLAISPTRAFGTASAELALCMDWQLMSALSKFEDLSCTPFGPVSDASFYPHALAAEGFDFLLEGCIDQLGTQNQIILRLRDLHMKGEVFWSQRICRPASGRGLFGADFATLLAPQIAAEISKHQAMALENCMDLQIDVRGLVLRASRAVQRLERHTLSAVDKLLADAISRDARHPALLVWLAYVKLMQLGQGWLSDIESPRLRIGELVDSSLALNPGSATVLAIAGHVLAFTQNRLEEGLSLQEKALSGNPNLPSAWLFSGLAHSYAGEHKEAIRRLRRAKLLSPADQNMYFVEMGLSLSHFLNGENASALTASRNAIRLNPNFSSSFKVGVAASGFMESERDEPPLLRHLLRLEPGLTVQRVLSRSPLTRNSDKTRLSDGMRLAGLPR